MRSVSLSSAETDFGRNAGDLGDDLLDVAQRHGLPPLVLGQQHARGADLVDHVDRLVRQLAVVDVLGRELDRGADRLLGVAHLVVALVIGLEPAQDLDGVLERGLVHVDLLEPAHQRAVLLEVVAELLVGGRADAAERAGGERRLQQVRRVHRAAAGRAGADHGVDLVDEQHRARLVLELRHDRLQPLLEIAAIARAGEQRAHVERVDRRFRQHLRHVALDDALGEALGDGGLADAGLADIERVVLGAAAEDLDRALDLVLAPDQRVDLAGGRLLVEVDAIGRERVLVAPARLLLALGLVPVLLAALHRPLRRAARRLGDAMADEVHRVEPGHVLQLQEIDRVALALAEQGDQHVGAGHLVAAGALHVDRGALHHALEAGGRLRIARPVGGEAGEVLVEELGQVVPQLVEIDPAGPQHGGGVAVIGEAEQQMFERRVFVPALAGKGQGAMKRLFQVS